MSTTTLLAEERLCPFPELWKESAHNYSDRIAITTEDGQWTYRELDQMSNVLAREIQALGVQHGSRVGLCLDRSIEAIAAMLGILKLGATFVPLDPEYPAERLRYMADDSALNVTVGHAHYQNTVGTALSAGTDSHDRQWLNCQLTSLLDAIADADDKDNPQDFGVTISPTDLAYIMYTSGSTGQPKGVQIQHASLATYCYADLECYGLDERDRTLQFSTLCFDIAIEEIFPPLLCGSSVVVRPRQRSEHANELSAIIREYQVTAIHLATAYWHQWVDLMLAAGDQVPSSLRLVIATGEKVSVEHYHRWRRLCQHDVLWCNAYGPTEATVSATVFIPEDDFHADHMPIGKPMKRYQAHILDESLHEVAPGETGQLFLSGPALALGYLNQPDRTRDAFIETTLDGQAIRLYRTGDLARWLPDGNIDFAGRIDHQIKLGSYRIEPGEIEAVISRSADVKDSLVVHEEIDGQKFLIAYVACTPNTFNLPGLVSELRLSLPTYMLPARYVLIESFPKTINGKIDRAALPSPSTGIVARDQVHSPPVTPTEVQLAELWKQALHVPEVSVEDDFFALGGSSLLVTQIIAKLTKEYDVSLPVRDFFANPRLGTLAQHLDNLLGNTDATHDDQRAWRERNQLPLVQAEYFASGQHQLYGVIYHPRTPNNRSPVLICHPIGHEYARAYRNLQQLALRLCQAGSTVMRFDYAGSGNSEGECTELTVENMLQNIETAKAFLAERSHRNDIAAVAIRFGATLLANLPPRLFSQIVLWDPVASGQSMLELFDDFHERALKGLTRYNQVRSKSQIDQSYGHQMTPGKRMSLSAISLPAQSLQRRNVTFVLSKGVDLGGVHSPEGDISARGEHVADEIWWDDPQFTESAFSSPQAYGVILRTLEQGES